MIYVQKLTELIESVKGWQLKVKDEAVMIEEARVGMWGAKVDHVCVVLSENEGIQRGDAR